MALPLAVAVPEVWVGVCCGHAATPHGTAPSAQCRFSTAPLPTALHFASQGSDYLTFKRTLARKFRFPEGMPAVPADLIEKLLVLEPTGRLGGREGETHQTILQHPWCAALRDCSAAKHALPDDTTPTPADSHHPIRTPSDRALAQV